MKLDYMDIAAFIERIIGEANEKGIEVTETEKLLDYMDENSDNFIYVIERK